MTTHLRTTDATVTQHPDLFRPVNPTDAAFITSFQGCFATEAEANKLARRIIGGGIVQQQAAGWCVFALTR